MTGKKKGKSWEEQKKLTPEEALELARKQFAPFWFGIPPLLAGMRSGGKVGLYPLDPSFKERNWLIAVMDPAEVSRGMVLDFCKELHRRYDQLGLTTVVILRPFYQALAQEDSIKLFVNKRALKFPIAIDSNGDLARALGLAQLPAVLVFSEGKKLFVRVAAELGELDRELQPFLRAHDPGLPLLPAFVPTEKVPVSAGAIEFGTRFGGAYPPAGVTMTGNWTREDERVLTSDSKARLSFKVQGTGLSIIARSVGKLPTPSAILTLVEDGAARPTEAGRDLSFDHEGNSKCYVNAPGLYNVLLGLQPGTSVTLGFPEASGTPVAIYGLRFIE